MPRADCLSAFAHKGLCKVPVSHLRPRGRYFLATVPSPTRSHDVEEYAFGECQSSEREWSECPAASPGQGLFPLVFPLRVFIRVCVRAFTRESRNNFELANKLQLELKLKS